MKRNNFILVFFILLMGCIAVPEYETPPIERREDYIVENTNIEAIISRINASEKKVALFTDTEATLWIGGYIVSNDESGNFYKEMYIQDNFENPKKAIKILVDKTNLHTTYPTGNKIYIKLNGLGAMFKNGVLTLGEYIGEDLKGISSFLIQEYIVRSAEQKTITPQPISLGDIDSTTIGKFVKIPNIHFSSDLSNKTFAGEQFDDFDGERRLVECESRRSILLSTSTFSRFKSLILPLSGGEISGIITRDFFNEKYILKINKITDLHFDSERCDPFFEENFESSLLGSFEKEKWTNYAQYGTKKWEVYTDEDALGKSLRMSAYKSGETQNVTWLITPEIDISTLTNPYFSFRSSVSFGDDSQLEVYISTNWNGNENTISGGTQWVDLNPTLASKSNNSNEWIDAGFISLSNYKTTPIRVAFKYTGSAVTTSDGTFEIDDIRIVEKN